MHLFVNSYQTDGIDLMLQDENAFGALNLFKLEEDYDQKVASFKKNKTTIGTISKRKPEHLNTIPFDTTKHYSSLYTISEQCEYKSRPRTNSTRYG